MSNPNQSGQNQGSQQGQGDRNQGKPGQQQTQHDPRKEQPGSQGGSNQPGGSQMDKDKQQQGGPSGGQR